MAKKFFEDQENMDENDDIVILHNEATDRDEEFYHIATLDVDKRWFIVLEPAEELDDIQDGEVLIYEIVEGKEQDEMVPVEDEKLLQKVFDEFLKMISEEEVEEEPEEK